MQTMAKGIAHVSFRGGGVFVPARSRSDRQLLIDRIHAVLRAGGQVQVLLDDRRWLVHGKPPQQPNLCSLCGYVPDVAWYRLSDDEVLYCQSCALGEQPHQTRQPESRTA